MKTLTPADIRRQLLADIAAGNIYFDRGFRQLYEGQPGPLAAGAVTEMRRMLAERLIEFGPATGAPQPNPVQLTTLGKLRHAEWQKL